jgi:hypothetical protein
MVAVTKPVSFKGYVIRQYKKPFLKTSLSPLNHLLFYNF